MIARRGALLTEARFTKPGGWVEWHEKHPFFMSDDGTLTEDHALRQWSRHFFEASKSTAIEVAAVTDQL
jgi:hypothetical protein